MEIFDLVWPESWFREAGPSRNRNHYEELRRLRDQRHREAQTNQPPVGLYTYRWQFPGVTPDQVTTQFEDGVLTVTIDQRRQG